MSQLFESERQLAYPAHVNRDPATGCKVLVGRDFDLWQKDQLPEGEARTWFESKRYTDRLFRGGK